MKAEWSNKDSLEMPTTTSGDYTGDEFGIIAKAKEEQLAKECQIGCKCIICGSFIPMRGSQDITPICINCRETLRKIVLKEQENE